MASEGLGEVGGQRVQGQKEEGSPARAFSLIELLVVIAIVAMLLSALVPSLQRARLRTRVVRVHADLRQICTALDAYALANGDKVPPTRFACGTNVNYQLPVELAKERLLSPGRSRIPQADMRDLFDPSNTYKYAAPGPIYQNGTFFDAPAQPWKPRAKLWVPDDFPACRSEEGRFCYNRSGEPPSPVVYAVWSIGPAPRSRKFPRHVESADVDETRFPLPRRFWLLHAGDTGLITHFKTRTGLVHSSP